MPRPSKRVPWPTKAAACCDASSHSPTFFLHRKRFPCNFARSSTSELGAMARASAYKVVAWGTSPACHARVPRALSAAAICSIALQENAVSASARCARGRAASLPRRPSGSGGPPGQHARSPRSAISGPRGHVMHEPRTGPAELSISSVSSGVPSWSAAHNPSSRIESEGCSQSEPSTNKRNSTARRDVLVEGRWYAPGPLCSHDATCAARRVRSRAF